MLDWSETEPTAAPAFPIAARRPTVEPLFGSWRLIDFPSKGLS
jgi:hypothetical protein